MKYRFEIWYQTTYMTKSASLLKSWDMDMDICLREVATFNYTGEEKTIDYFKNLLTNVFSMLDMKILKIEGGKVE